MLLGFHMFLQYVSALNAHVNRICGNRRLQEKTKLKGLSFKVSGICFSVHGSLVSKHFMFSKDIYYIWPNFHFMFSDIDLISMILKCLLRDPSSFVGAAFSNIVKTWISEILRCMKMLSKKGPPWFSDIVWNNFVYLTQWIRGPTGFKNPKITEMLSFWSFT